jgi:hypothetical protein
MLDRVLSPQEGSPEMDAEVLRNSRWYWDKLDNEDLLAVHAALTEFIEKRNEEAWVEWPWGGGSRRVWQRCRVDGSEMQFSAFQALSQAIWHPEPEESGVVEAYRKGREVALKEMQDLTAPIVACAIDQAARLADLVTGLVPYVRADNGLVTMPLLDWRAVLGVAEKLSAFAAPQE